MCNFCFTISTSGIGNCTRKAIEMGKYMKLTFGKKIFSDVIAIPKQSDCTTRQTENRFLK